MSANESNTLKHPRLKREARTLSAMVSIYCHQCHKKKMLCADCAALLEYALKRLEACRFQELKPTCARCPVHCYRPEMRERVREVMRYSGPRMIFRHPILAGFHLLDKRRTAPTARKS